MHQSITSAPPPSGKPRGYRDVTFDLLDVMVEVEVEARVQRILSARETQAGGTVIVRPDGGRTWIAPHSDWMRPLVAVAVESAS